jgi:hypothetical protein
MALHIRVHSLTSSPTDLSHEPPLAYVGAMTVPHAFQQKLLHKKILNLHQVLTSFHQMIAVWEHLKKTMPFYASVIDAGVTKLNQYWNSVKDVLAYTLAQCKFPILIDMHSLIKHLFSYYTHSEYQKHALQYIEWAKNLFIDSVSFRNTKSTIENNN